MNPFETYKNVLEDYLHPEVVPYLETAWKEPHRKYHTTDHLVAILKYVEKLRFHLPPNFFDALVLGAFFHDVYYNPRDSKNNEDESIKRFVSSYSSKKANIMGAVIAMIEATKHRKRPKDYLIRIFWEADNDGFTKGYNELLKNEKLIRNEFNHLPNSVYKRNRITFLKTNIGLFSTSVDADINKLIEYVQKNY